MNEFIEEIKLVSQWRRGLRIVEDFVLINEISFNEKKKLQPV